MINLFLKVLATYTAIIAKQVALCVYYKSYNNSFKIFYLAFCLKKFNSSLWCRLTENLQSKIKRWCPSDPNKYPFLFHWRIISNELVSKLFLQSLNIRSLQANVSNFGGTTSYNQFFFCYWRKREPEWVLARYFFLSLNLINI